MIKPVDSMKGNLTSLMDDSPEINESTDLKGLAEDERLDFRVSDDFKTRFAVFATANKLSQKDLMILAFNEFHQKYNGMNKAARKEQITELKQRYKLKKK